MEILDNIIYDCLKEIDNKSICFVCKKKWESPIRIKVCGHYFCSKCLKVDNACCPKCFERFLPGEIDRDTLEKEVACHIEVLRNSLHTVKKRPDQQEDSKLPETKQEKEHKASKCDEVLIDLTDSASSVKVIEEVDSPLPESFKGFNTKSVKPAELKEIFRSVDISKKIASRSPKKLNKRKQTSEASENSNKSELFGYKEPQIIYWPQAIFWREDDLSSEFLETEKICFEFVNAFPGRINIKGETPLHIACKKKNLGLVKELISKGANINAKDYAGWTPMHEAIQSESLEIVEELLKNGALPNIPGREYLTPLHHAVLKGNPDIIRVLIDNGAAKSFLDIEGKKPIDYCKSDVIKKLLEQEVCKKQCLRKIACLKKITIYIHGIREHYICKLQAANDVTIGARMDLKQMRFTHFVLQNKQKLTKPILLGMLEGLIFVTEEWIDSFINQQYSIPVTIDTVLIDDTNLNLGLKKSIMNKLLGRPKLFDSINFFIKDHEIPVGINGVTVDKNFLTKLVTTGSGNILKRAPTPVTVENEVFFPFHSVVTNSKLGCCRNYIIFEKSKAPILQYNMPELKHKSSNWLLKCIINFCISD